MEIRSFKDKNKSFSIGDKVEVKKIQNEHDGQSIADFVFKNEQVFKYVR